MNLKILATAMVMLTAQRAPFHPSHEARHGGLFFSAAHDTLHIEGVWPEQRRFKLFVSDALGRPLPEDRLRAVSGRVMIGEVPAPLTIGPDAEFLEARLPSIPVPAELVVELNVPPNDEEGFHFTFYNYSDERNAVFFDISPTVIPDSLAGILAALQSDMRDAEQMFARAQLAFVYAAADRAHDRVLALEPFLSRLPSRDRPRAEAQIVDAVRAAWLLHVASDQGSAEQAVAALAAWQSAITEISASFQGVAR